MSPEIEIIDTKDQEFILNCIKEDKEYSKFLQNYSEGYG